MKHLTLTDAAKQLGVDKSTVAKAVAKHAIPTELIGTAKCLDVAGMAKLKSVIRGTVGNPSFTPGNYFGGAKKRPKAARRKPKQ